MREDRDTHEVLGEGLGTVELEVDSGRDRDPQIVLGESERAASPVALSVQEGPLASLHLRAA